MWVQERVELADAPRDHCIPAPRCIIVSTFDPITFLRIALPGRWPLKDESIVTAPVWLRSSRDVYFLSACPRVRVRSSSDSDQCLSAQHCLGEEDTLSRLRPRENFGLCQLHKLFIVITAFQPSHPYPANRSSFLCIRPLCHSLLA